METKLILHLDDSLIASAKEYSARTGKSVSSIISDFLKMLKNSREEKETQLPPTVQSLKGALKGSGGQEGDYKKHLEEKCL
ncbi:MAG: antitoxin [Candidatus Electrothrix sp. ATG1]|nr:antitoxin [Candidatus Electrothrix sp. ATG1]